MIIRPETLPEWKWKLFMSQTEKNRRDIMYRYDYGPKVIELGCEYGVLAAHLCKSKQSIKRYAGVEINSKLKNGCLDLMKANNIDYFELINCDGSNVSKFHDEYFDTVLLVEVLEHVRNPILLLLEGARLVKQNKNMIISVPCKGGMPPEKVSCHLQDFSIDDMKTMIKLCNLTLLEHFTSVPWEFYVVKK